MHETTEPEMPEANAACSKCSAPFHCGAEEDWCWCDQVKLAPEQRARLTSLGLEGCLCRDCLQSL